MTLRIPELTLARLLSALVFIAVFTMAVRVPADSDTWWHLASGRYIVEQGRIPMTDPFSHTRMGAPWIDHGWLAQLLLYGTYVLGGWAALALSVAALVTAAWWFVYRQCEGQPYVRAFAIVWGAITSSVIWAARPQLVSFVLAALVAFLLHRYKRRNGRLLPWLPLVVLVWANVHGGYAIAFILILCYLVGETLNRLTGHAEDSVLATRRLVHLVIVAGVCFVVVGVNPHIWQMWLYPFRTVGIGVLQDFIQEWQSPDFHQVWQQPFLVLLLVTVLALARAGRRADFTDLALLSVWSAAALLAGRNIAIFALVSAPILVRYASQALQRQLESWRDIGWAQRWLAESTRPLAGRRLLSALNWLLLVVVVAAALVKVYLPLRHVAVDAAVRETMPVEAVETIRGLQPPGPMFNSYNWGGYLIFTLWPEYPVFVDGRTDLYDDVFLRSYLDIYTAADGWQEQLAGYDVRLVIVERDSILARFLRLEPASWHEVFRDELAAVFTRYTE
jgi:hypothetical protein